MSEVAHPYALTLAARCRSTSTCCRRDIFIAENAAELSDRSLNAPALREADRWLAYYRQFWSSRLDALAKHLEGEHR